MSLSWNPAAAWLLHSAVGGGLLLLLTCLLIRRTRQPARRQRLGELGLAAALVLALLSLRPPWLVLSYPVPAAPPAAPAEAAPPEADDDLVFAWVVPPGAAAPDVAPAAPQPPPLAAREPEPAAEPASPWWQTLLAAVLPWLVLAHAVGAALLLSRWLLGHWALARLLRGATPAPAEVARLFAAMTPDGRRPRLLVARRLRVPLSCGLLRPTVVLPAALCVAPDLQKLRWVFAHELTHLERRDAWSAALFALGRAVYFFLPWFGWLRRQVRLCQEYVADAAAAGQEEPAVDYAEFLLSLTGAPAVPAAATGVSGNCSDLYRRVSMLLKEPLRVEKRCPRRWSLTAAAGLFSLAVLVGGVGLRAEAADDIVIVVRGTGGADKQAKSEEKKVQVFVVPGHGEGGQQPKVLLRKKVPDGPQGVRRIVVEKGDALNKPGVHAREERVKIIRAGDIHQPADVVIQGKIDVHLEELHKALQKLKQHGGADMAEVQKEIHKVLEKIHGGAALRNVQRAEDHIVLQGKKTEKKSGKDLDAALDALRKALEGLGKQPELEGARQGLKQAIEQLEKTRNLGFFPPARALVVPPGKKWEFGPQGLNMDFGKWMEFADQGKWRDFAKQWQGQAFGHSKPVDPEMLKKVGELLRQQKYAEAEALLKKAVEGAQAQQWRFQFQPQQGQNQIVRSRRAGAAGLGVGVEKPSGALADQLNLPRGQGLIVTSVKPNSPAAKAGLKVNDVLLKLAGVAVPGEPKEFDRVVDRIKGGEAVSATVLRKGKEETIGGIKLDQGGMQFGIPQSSREKAAPGQQAPLRVAGGKGGVMTTLTRNGDRFTARYQEGSLSINLTGTVAGGKARASEIAIQDGRQDHRYQSVEQVPARYRDKVNHLLEISGRGETRIERK
jgi:beta-lactamase regulating signal transducer with metallopeptidase domain